jgi:hypothetical protein
VTEFLFDHPGSIETLLENCGSDVTEAFYEIGHSDYALSLMQSFCVFDAHRLYLSQDPWKHSKYKHSFNHLKIRNLPSVSPLHESMKTVQKEIAKTINRPIPSLQAAAALFTAEATEDEKSKESSSLFFSDLHKLAPKLGGYLNCSNNDHNHASQPKSFFDPLSREWVVWFPCCGRGRTLLKIPEEILQTNPLRSIFES